MDSCVKYDGIVGFSWNTREKLGDVDATHLNPLNAGSIGGPSSADLVQPHGLLPVPNLSNLHLTRISVFMMEAPATWKPFVSRMINQSEDDETVSLNFGNTWQQCLLPVKYFRIRVGYGYIQAIHNIPEGDTTTDCAATVEDFVFAPMEDELVSQVDVRHIHERITAVRFHTNKQVSQWVGYTNGKACSLVAPAGYYIHCVVGKWIQATPSSQAVDKLGVIFHPRCPEPSLLVLPPPGQYLHSPLDDEHKNVDAYSDLSAIMVKIGGDYPRHGISALSILSASQFRKYSALSHVIQHPFGDHVVTLTAGEKVAAVHTQTETKCIKKVRFVTNYRTTPWFGNTREDELPVQVLDLIGQPEGAYICGFQTTGGGRVAITSLGVVYRVPTPTGAAGSSDIEEEEGYSCVNPI